MSKFIAPIALLLGLVLTGCTAPVEENAAPPVKTTYVGSAVVGSSLGNIPISTKNGWSSDVGNLKNEVAEGYVELRRHDREISADLKKELSDARRQVAKDFVTKQNLNKDLQRINERLNELESRELKSTTSKTAGKALSELNPVTKAVGNVPSNPRKTVPSSKANLLSADHIVSPTAKQPTGSALGAAPIIEGSTIVEGGKLTTPLKANPLNLTTPEGETATPLAPVTTDPFDPSVTSSTYSSVFSNGIRLGSLGYLTNDKRANKFVEWTGSPSALPEGSIYCDAEFLNGSVMGANIGSVCFKTVKGSYELKFVSDLITDFQGGA